MAKKNTRREAATKRAKAAHAKRGAVAAKHVGRRGGAHPRNVSGSGK